MVPMKQIRIEPGDELELRKIMDEEGLTTLGAAFHHVMLTYRLRGEK